MKKIFFVTNEMSGGGAERVMTVLANYLVGKGHDVTFIVLQGYDSLYELNDKVKIKKWGDTKRGDPIGQIKFIRSFMKCNPGGIFISFFAHQSLYSIMASKGTNVKVVVSERNDPEHSICGIGKKILRNVLYSGSSCDKIVFQTSGAALYFPQKIKDKGTIIPNPLKSGLPDRYKGERSKRVVSIGRFENQKNYELLIRTFALFSERYDDYKLVLYGKGSLEDELKNTAQKLNIIEKVEFAGFHKDVHQLALDAAMFVLPSDYEGLSNSMLEAMAIGLPVICTDCPPGGAREYIKEKENGMLVPIGNEKRMYEAMCYMAENPDEANKMGERASVIRNILNNDTICRQWERVIIGE